MSMFEITPEYLTGYVNFWYNDPDWKYQREGEFSIPKIQAEGAAKLWNLLLKTDIALLADEVGMGKTIQALAVMATLWRQKPEAKVLLYAPNENVALKWKREYENFIRYHYRHTDNVVKSSIKGMPLRTAVYCENHLQLMQEACSQWPSFFICKTSSLSVFLSPKLNDAALENIGVRIRRTVDHTSPEEAQSAWMTEFGKQCNQRFYELFSGNNPDQPPFDLIIFDEAHYLRRAEGDSYRSIAAHAFFAGRDIHAQNARQEFRPLAKKVLLLTATPNHSSPGDIVNITSLFHPNYWHKDPLHILQEICVRRFRRLEGKTKHEYRDEIPEGVVMQHLREKLFFAAYHKSLVSERARQQKENIHKSRLDNPYRVLFGYLEGFEFLPQRIEGKDKKNVQYEGPDFTHREDAEVIVNLSQKYKQVYKVRPEHPKYQKIIERLQPNKENAYAPEKKLVFVRRIASVYEISNRVIEDYDLAFKRFLQPIFNKKQLKKIERAPRAFFWQLAKRDADVADLAETVPQEQSADATEGISNIESKLLSLFTIKKDGKFRTTDCSNFRNRFLKKEQIFSVFFEPPFDYEKNHYRLKSIRQNGQSKRAYKLSTQELRIKELDLNTNQRLILEQHYNLDDPEYDKVVPTDLELETLITIWLTYAIKSPESTGRIVSARQEYARFSIMEKEAFSRYLEKGILFSSQFIVRFYVIYRNIVKQQNLRGEELYKAFCEEVKKMIEESELASLIARAALTFKIFYKKEVGQTEETVIRYGWTFLNDTLPVYPYCGDTKRESIIKAFNSPFYPNVLIATSVLQEGVDLHYHCSEVIHYGIAWTQGDNEQRVGRVDRMFGKLETQLKSNPTATLPIHYPYLKNTIDQDQVARFIMRKRDSEKLLDQLEIVNFSNEINFREQVTEDEWHSCFNKPGGKTIESDPFPVNYSKEFDHVTVPHDKGYVQSDLSMYLTPLFNTLKQHFGGEFVLFNTDVADEQNQQTFAIKHIRLNKRDQPVIGELSYSEQGLYFMKKPVYRLRISTPLAKTALYLGDIYKYGLMKNFYKNNPLLKICLDRTRKSYFKVYVCADLPLFSVGSGDFNASHAEVIHIIESLIHFTDELEQLIYRRGFDIKNETVIQKDLMSWDDITQTKLSQDRMANRQADWIRTDSGHYLYKEKAVESCEYRTMYIFNHEQPYLRKMQDGPQTKVQAGVYMNDALEEECILLNNILISNSNF